MDIKPESRLLFMKYALPCAGTLVKRGAITQKELDLMQELVRKGEEVHPKKGEAREENIAGMSPLPLGSADVPPVPRAGS